MLGRLPKRSGLLAVLALAVILRVICGFGGYSGVNDPPTFGDYEAQRHWMELTVNLPPRDWYVETKHNNLTYWRIDYPPVSAYLSYLCGVLSHRYEQKSMELFTSRGYETPSHKMFMRWTVLACDILLFISALTAFVLQAYRKYDFRTRLIALTLVLASPLLILIDHGHFQYNCVTLGLTLWALILCVSEDIWIGSVLFVIALNVKQMALYYSIPFFAFIIGKIYRICNLHIRKHQDSISLRTFQFFAFIVQVGIFVVVSMIIIWWPWISSLQEISSVLKAIFPVKRGLYQLKVATFWCVTDVLYKWQTHFSTDTLLLLSVGFTLLAALPSAVILAKVPKRKYFIIALFNVSMAFFFFSYHVHEKTILLPILPFILNIRYFRTFYVDYILTATFTNYHMFVEDKLTLEYFMAMTCFAFFAHPVLQTFRKMWKKPVTDDKSKDVVQKTLDTFEEFYLKYISKGLYVAMIGLTAADKFIMPPEKYPFLFHLLFAVVGFAEFFMVFVYSNVKLYLCYKKDYQREIDALNYDMKALLGKTE